MVKICVLQTDNRPTLNYLLKTQEINKKFCDILGYEYLFLELDNNKYGNINPATKKIYVINNFLRNTECDILVFLDSDAWIQNGYWLDTIIRNLIKNEQKQGCFSRDPYVKHNTFINSGSFILKINDFTKQMYSNIVENLCNNPAFHNTWPYDQYYISNYIFENKEKFVIFIPHILNTPMGEVLRHNWCKNQRMYIDLNKLSYELNNNLCVNELDFMETDNYDDQDFPNIIINGYEYFD